MPYVNVTQELRDTIKEERKKRGKSTVELSTDISKGKAYISQVESGKISSIELKTFYDIFENLIDMSSEQRDEYIQNNILNKFTINLSEDEINKQVWMITFDLQTRQFPINNSLRQFIKEKRENIQKSPEELVEYINLNNDLDEEHAKTLEPNRLFVEFKSEASSIIQINTIKFKLPQNIINRIENGSLKTISYIFMQGILYNLFRLEEKNPVDSSEEAKIIMRNNGFLTISEREKVINENFKQKIDNNEDFQFYDLEPTNLEKEYAKTLEEINSGFKYIRDKNIIYANKQVKKLLKNMKSDLGLMFAIFGIPFNKLESLDVESKKNLIMDIKNIVNSYIPPELDPNSSQNDE